MPASTPLRGHCVASTPLRARRAVPASTPLRARSAVPTSAPLRARNPTLRRLGALRVWTLARIDIIAIQPDLPDHKSEPGGSFLIPGFCEAFVLPLQRYRFLKPCRQCPLPLRSAHGGQCPHPHRFARCNPAAVPLPHRFARCNPTLQRLEALRVWTLARIDIIAIQPDPTGQPQCGLHSSEPVRSFHVPGRRRGEGALIR